MPKYFDSNITDYAMTLWTSGWTGSDIIKQIKIKFNVDVSLPTIYLWTNKYWNPETNTWYNRKPISVEPKKDKVTSSERRRVKRVMGYKNLLPSHIYKAIREYYAKGYTAKKIGGIIKKEFPEDININHSKLMEVIYRTKKNTANLTSTKAEVTQHIPVDRLGIFDGTEKSTVSQQVAEVSNVHPTVFKPGNIPTPSVSNTSWEINTAIVTTENGDRITFEFSNETLKEFIRETLM